MQYTGHVMVDGQIVLVLVRTKRHSHQLKLRQSGQPGRRLTDEEIFLEQDTEQMQRLMAGKVIEL